MAPGEKDFIIDVDGEKIGLDFYDHQKEINRALARKERELSQKEQEINEKNEKAKEDGADR